MKWIGYFDESEDDEWFCLAGLLMTPEGWAPFDVAWQAMLARYDLPEFHMEHCENRTGWWEQWLNVGARRRVQSRFVSLLVSDYQLAPGGFVVGVNVRDYDALGFGEPIWLFAFRRVMDIAGSLQGLSNETLDRVERAVLVMDRKAGVPPSSYRRIRIRGTKSRLPTRTPTLDYRQPICSHTRCGAISRAGSRAENLSATTWTA
jgi:hypothetical protein